MSIGVDRELSAEDLIRQEEEFFKIMGELIERAEEEGIVLRVLGAIAFRNHCHSFKHLEYECGRMLTDIDFVGYKKDQKKIESIFTSLGYEEDRIVKRLFPGKRLIFYKDDGLHFDVFLDKLEMCHDIDFRERLEIDRPTIPLAEMILEKMQIVEINEKDLIDTLVLLREHEIGDGDHETINGAFLVELLSEDWGFWRTVTMNLGKVRQFMKSWPPLSGEDREDIEKKLDKILRIIDDAPKGKKWLKRAKVGDRKKWYREVEEYDR